MKRFLSYIEEIRKQKKLTKTQVYLASFGILLFLTIAITLPNYVLKNQQSTKSQAQAAGTFYVSATNGNDTWSGLLEAPNGTNTDGPFRTLARAQTAMRSSSTIKMTTIRSGTYSIDGINLIFNAQDSNETWIPYQNEMPIINGGTTVTHGTSSNGLSTVTVTHNGGYVRASGANNLTIEGLTFQNLGDPGANGEAGMHLSGSGYTIRWNTVKNCLYRCLTGSAFQSSTIDSNTFDTQYPGNPDTVNFFNAAYAVMNFWYQSHDNHITHNLIKNTDGGGIVFGSNAGDLPMGNNIIDRNLLQNINQSVGDMAGLYLFDSTGSVTGDQITNNVVFNNGGAAHSTKCIYLDNNVSNVLVKGNLCAKAGLAQGGEYGVFYHGGKNNTVTNNIFELAGVPNYTDLWGNNAQNGAPYLGGYQALGTDMSGNSFKNNIIFTQDAWPSPLWQTLGSNPTPPTVTSNNYFSYTGKTVSN
jgi:hypothetical protein